MDVPKPWLKLLKKHVVSNVGCIFILLGLEKLVEMEFRCPCDPKWNRLFTSTFFILPAITAFMMMLKILGPGCNKVCKGALVYLSSLIPALVWLVILFFDGQYFACVKSNWNGTFVISKEDTPRKWCEPDEAVPTQMDHHREFLVQSQVIGLALLLVIFAALTFFLCLKCCCTGLQTEITEQQKEVDKNDGKKDVKKVFVSHVVCSFILLGLEKIVEMEFRCPCDPKWNRLFTSAFFIIPAITAFVVMIIVQGPTCKQVCKRACKWALVYLSSLIPPLVWLIILFFDGQYFACAKSNWNGTFVIANEDAPRKWCEPDEDVPTQMDHHREFLVQSQGIGMALLLVICAAVTLSVFKDCSCGKCCGDVDEENEQRKNDEEIELNQPPATASA
ncbi:calcium homeostasis modulator protein 6 [Oncorhynchus kisutch]|uniref:calcium homeostasis modulator protein 6 n=1 Tax=Oncorhynchus kisutch TaxID=8019 RepID=UPI0009A0267F|nr:calcium homeostasis modulator protein 6 [Oncorhynchus kisutch]XP_031657918.1 calcium homeostasis modulator protein 6 [Oncorhynchus kisutch]